MTYIPVVWVLMAITHNGFAVPTIEFASEAKCKAAIVTLESAYRPTKYDFVGHCIKIEK